MKKIKLCIAATAMFFGVTNSFAQQRGYYDAPYTRYEANVGTSLSNATSSGPNYDQANITFEASDRTAVNVKNGGSVQWTVTGSFNRLGIVLRAAMAGDGQSATVTVAVNGSNKGTMTVNTKYSYESLWNNGNENNNGISNQNWRMRYDEFRLLVKESFSGNTTIKLTSNSDNLWIDFIEVESVENPKTAPSGSVSFGGGDNLQGFIDAGNSGKTIFIPEGTHNINRDLWMGGDNTTLVGAGMWYSTLNFTATNSNNGGVHLSAAGQGVKDLALTTNQSSRSNAYKGIWGTSQNATIENVWVEHFECGIWFGKYGSETVNGTNNMTIKHSRFRNNYADGINFCKGANNNVAEHCSFRNNGDDDMAVWPANGQQCYNNTFRYCTAENCWRASSCALYGGYGNKWQYIIVKDNFEVGIRVNSMFSGAGFADGTANEFSNIDVIGCGTPYNIYGNTDPAVDITTCGQAGTVKNINFSCLNIKDSKFDAIEFRKDGGNDIQNISMNGITINGANRQGQNQNSGWGDAGGIRFVNSPNINNVTFCGSFANVQGENVVDYGKPGSFNAQTSGCTSCATSTPEPTSVTISNCPTTNPTAGATVNLSASVQPSGASQTITWSSSNNDIATVSSSGVVTTKTAGNVTITATSTNASVKNTCNFTINAATIPVTSVSLNKSTTTICKNATETLTATIAPNNATNKTVSWSSNATGVATVNSSGTITAHSAGTATITVTTADGNKTANCSVTVPADLTQNNPAATSICSGSTYTFNLAAASGGSGNITYNWQQSTNNSNWDDATGTRNGQNYTTPALSSNMYYRRQATAATCGGAINSNSALVTVTASVGGTLSPSDTKVCGGASVTISLSGHVGTVQQWEQSMDGGYTWPNIMPVNSIQIHVMATNNSKSRVLVKNGDCPAVYSTMANITITNVPAQPSIIGTTNTVAGTTGLNYSVNQVLDETYTWSVSGAGWSITSSNTGSSITVTAGTANGTITVTPSNTCGTGTSQTLPVTVSAVTVPVTGVTISPKTQTVNVGTPVTFSTIFAPSNASNQNVTYNITEGSQYGTLNNNVLTTTGAGTIKVRVTSADGGKTDEATITVNAVNVPVTGVTISPKTQTVTAGGTVTFSTIFAPSNASNQNVTYNITEGSQYGSLNNNVLTTTGAGTIKVRVTSADGGKTDEATITVTSAGGGGGCTLDRTGWEAYAPNYVGTHLGGAEAVLDGNLESDWNCAEQNGQLDVNKWLVVDMKAMKSFEQIVLIQRPDKGDDYLRGFKVEIANEVVFNPSVPIVGDGYAGGAQPTATADWVTIVANGVGTPDSTVINLPTAQTARYIKITRTDFSSGNWWAFAEFLVRYCGTPSVCTPVPTTANITAGKETLSQGETTTITLASSLNGVTYTLYLNGGAVPSSTNAGNGGNLVWTVGEKGTYTIKATGNGATYCNTTVTMNKSITITVTTPCGSGNWDLVVDDFTWSPAYPQIGDPVVFTATIKNIGGTPTPNGQKHGVVFDIVSGVWGEESEWWITNAWNDLHYSSIPACSSVQLTVNGGTNGAIWYPGENITYHVRAWVADNGGVADSEENRNNNFLYKFIEIGVVTGDLAKTNNKTITAYGNTVEIKGVEKGETVTVYNLLGMKVYSARAIQDPELITTLQQGIYTVVIEGTNVVQKVLIVR